MIVTDKKYHLETKLVEKLNIMINRCTKKKFDNLVIVDGAEGYGKSTLSVAMAYYFAYETGRSFSVDNIFFKINELMEFATKTKDQIIIWDEAAIEGLATDWQSKLQRKLIKLLMVVRKKRHFFIFNIPRFFKLNEYIIVDRAIALIHVYARRETQLGRMVYFNRKSKDSLYSEWKRNKVRAYGKYKRFGGTFPDVLAKLIDEKTYEAKKDKAIESLTEVEVISAKERKLLKLQYAIYLFKGMTQVQKAKHFNISKDTISDWGKIPQKHPKILENWQK